MITKEITKTDNGLTGLIKFRLAQFTIGMKFNIYQHGIAFRFLYGHIADCVGILNIFRNTKLQALFIDFDANNIVDIYDYIQYLHDEYFLGNIFVFESSKNHFNIICPNLLSISIIREIMLECPFIDKKFLNIYVLNGDNTIRITPKFTEKSNREINLVYVSERTSPYLSHNGLVQIIKRHFYIPDIDYGYLDNSTENDVIYKEYETLQW